MYDEDQLEDMDKNGSDNVKVGCALSRTVCFVNELFSENECLGLTLHLEFQNKLST